MNAHKLNAALSCIIAGAFSALFLYITGRRIFERDVTGALFAAAMSFGMVWATVRTFRRWQRS